MDMKEVTEYSIDRNTWSTHSQFAVTIYSSSAVVLGEIVYNFGGVGSNSSVYWYNLMSNDVWSPMDLPDCSFLGYLYGSAYVISNNIVYFGTNRSTKIFVMEEKEG